MPAIGDVLARPLLVVRKKPTHVILRRQPLQCCRNFVKSFAVRNGLELYVLLTP